MFKLGVPATDKASGIKGVLTTCVISGDGKEFYGLEPAALSDDGKSPTSIGLTADRIDAPTDSRALPISVIGTKVTHKNTGFTGIITSLAVHQNGCVHAIVLPKGINKKTGSAFDEHEFDLRTLEGPAIKKLSEPELVESRRTQPSPESNVARQRL